MYAVPGTVYYLPVSCNTRVPLEIWSTGRGTRSYPIAYLYLVPGKRNRRGYTLLSLLLRLPMNTYSAVRPTSSAATRQRRLGGPDGAAECWLELWRSSSHAAAIIIIVGGGSSAAASAASASAAATAATTAAATLHSQTAPSSPRMHCQI